MNTGLLECADTTQDEVEGPGMREERPSRTKKVGQGQKRWRHEMEVPGHGKSAGNALWEFVAGHVEDRQGGKPCPLAVKAWREIPGYLRVECKKRTAAGLLPERIAARRPRRLSSVSVEWNSK